MTQKGFVGQGMNSLLPNNKMPKLPVSGSEVLSRIQNSLLWLHSAKPIRNIRKLPPG
jgi:hypothetical protein